MAFSPKFVCLLFVLISLSSSLEIYARDSQFFSKVTRINPTKDVEFVHLNKQEDQQPAFIPQTTETGYGLYGHETGLNPPSTPSTTLYNMDQNNAKFDNFYSQNKYDESNFNNNNKYDENNFNNKYDESNFNNNKYDESNFNNKYDESNFNNKYDESNFNFNNKNKYDESNFNNNNKDNNYEFFKYDNNKNTNEDEKNYAPELKGLSGFSNNNNNNNNKNYGYNGGVEKQGMSDTRFLENGKYFYDVEAEKNFDANNNNNYMSYANNYNNNYNTNGYYGNNYESYNNQKNGNGMQGYQNKVQEDEFDFDDQP